MFEPIVEMVCRDIVRLFKLRCGNNVFGRYQDKKGVWRDVVDAKRLKKFVHKVVNAISSSIVGHGNWRKLKKLELEEHPLAESYLQHLRAYHATKDPRHLEMFKRERDRVLKQRIDEIGVMSLPYVRVPRSTKKMLLQHIREKSKPINDLIEFLKMARRWLRKMDVEVDDDRLAKWFKAYRRSLNMTRKGEKHSSKWSRIFNGKSKDEISTIIDNLDVSKQMKYRLRENYLKKSKPRVLGIEDLVNFSNEIVLYI